MSKPESTWSQTQGTAEAHHGEEIEGIPMVMLPRSAEDRFAGLEASMRELRDMLSPTRGTTNLAGGNLPPGQATAAPEAQATAQPQQRDGNFVQYEFEARLQYPDGATREISGTRIREDCVVLDNGSVMRWPPLAVAIVAEVRGWPLYFRRMKTLAWILFVGGLWVTYVIVLISAILEDVHVRWLDHFRIKFPVWSLCGQTLLLAIVIHWWSFFLRVAMFPIRFLRLLGVSALYLDVGFFVQNALWCLFTKECSLPPVQCFRLKSIYSGNCSTWSFTLVFAPFILIVLMQGRNRIFYVLQWLLKCYAHFFIDHIIFYPVVQPLFDVQHIVDSNSFVVIFIRNCTFSIVDHLTYIVLQRQLLRAMHFTRAAFTPRLRAS